MNRFLYVSMVLSVLSTARSLVSCPVGSYSNTAGNACNKCDAGKYQDIVGSTYCKNCPANSWTSLLYPDQDKDHVSDCLCNHGYWRPSGDSACYKCLDGLYTYGNGATQCMPARNNEVCTAGQYIERYDVSTGGIVGVRCSPCPLNTYNTKAMYEVWDPIKKTWSICLKCASGSSSALPAGSTVCVCDIGHYKTPGGTECTKCTINTYTASTGQTSCTLCATGKYSLSGATECIDCPLGWYGASAGGGCGECPQGTIGSMRGATSCDPCKACPDNEYRVDCTVNPEEWCYDLGRKKSGGQWRDYRDRWCWQYSTTGEPSCSGEGRIDRNGEGSASEQCCKCGGGVRTAWRPPGLQDEHIGVCVPCPACTNPNEVRVGCMNNAGHNNAVGRCVPRDHVVQAPTCPRRPVYVEKNSDDTVTVELAYTEQVGLGGFTFREVFGVEFNEAPFQCRRMCDGHPREDNAEMYEEDRDPEPGMRDSGTCAGPFACNIAACTMLSSYDDIAVESDYQVPRACPVAGSPGADVTFPATISVDSDPLFYQRMNQPCQLCATCGDPSLNNNRIPGYGLGCAAECTRLVCEELGTIYDWTDGYPEYDVALAKRALIDRCKSCDDLRDVRLCSDASGRFAAGAVSGNRPLIRFDGCVGKQSPATLAGQETTPQYGGCVECDLKAFECGPREYPDSCTAQTWPCKRCLPRGVEGVQVRFTPGSYHDSSGAEQTLFCQFTCADGWTGVQESNKIERAMCARECTPPQLCDADEIALPCSVPHDSRCVPRHPQLAAGDTRIARDMLPAHANMLETTVSAADPGRLFTSFENVFIDLGEQEPHLHQCVWNAVDVRDNDKTPGGVSYTVWRAGMGYAFPLTQMGSKWCQWSLYQEPDGLWSDWAFNRSMDVRFPLLPLQNVVASGPAEPRRLLLNTSARAMRYCDSSDSQGECVGGYNGQGVNMAAQQALYRYWSRARVGDLYLGLEMRNARNATVHVTLPSRLKDATWVPKWRFSFLARDATGLDQAWVKSRTFSARVVPLAGADTPTLGEAVERLTVQRVTLPIASELGSAQTPSSRRWRTDAQPVVFCAGADPKTQVFVARSYQRHAAAAQLIASAGSSSAVFSLIDASDGFPALAFGDLRTGLLLMHGTAANAAAGPHTALRAAIKSATCVAYYSTERTLYCVTTSLQSTVIRKFDLGSIDDFVVVSKDALDYLLVRMSGVQIARFVTISPTGGSPLALPTAVNSGSTTVLQFASNSNGIDSDVVAVKQVAGELWLHPMGVDNCVTGPCVRVHTGSNATLSFSAAHVVLAVSPAGRIMLVVLHPEQEWLWLAFYTRTGTNIASTRLESPSDEQFDALVGGTGEGDISSSTTWVDEDHVLLAKRSDVCEASVSGKTAALVCTHRPELEGRRFARVLNGFMVLGDAKISLLALLPDDMVKLEASACKAGFHAFEYGTQTIMMTYTNGPLYVTDGEAHIAVPGAELNHIPHALYTSTGLLKAFNPEHRVQVPQARDELGYHFTTVWKCEFKASWPLTSQSNCQDNGELVFDIEVTRQHFRMRSPNEDWVVQSVTSWPFALKIGIGIETSPTMRGRFTDTMLPVDLPLQQWQLVYYVMRPAVLQASTAIAVQFERRQTFTKEEPIHEVVALDLLELLVDLVLEEVGSVLTVYIPTQAELAAVGLAAARRGSDITDWERMHVTVRASPETCQFRVRIVSLGTLLPHVGCVGAGECQLEIPMADVGANRRAQLQVDGDCVDLGVVLQPMTTLYECGANEFWSADFEECRSCDENPEDVCPPGKYIHGCDLLRAPGERDCRDCAWPAPEMQDTAQWVAGGICQLRCRDGYYRAAVDKCLPCTTEKENTCALTAGSQWQACSATAQEQCVPCPPIQKGVASRSEVYVANTACLTRCVQGHYRSSVHPYACLPCTSYSAMLLLARLESRDSDSQVCHESPYARFQACTNTSDAVSIPCVELDYATVTGNALGFGVDCPRACVTGSHLQVAEEVRDSVVRYAPEFRAELSRLQTPTTQNFSWEMYSCVICEPVLDSLGVQLPAGTYWVVSGCDYRCNQSGGYYQRNTSILDNTRVCTFCGTRRNSPCPAGAYPVGNCTRCAPCKGSLRGAWNFTSPGLVDDPGSCEQTCAAGWFRDWFSEECRPHTRPTCRDNQYLLAGTPTSDAFCAQCRSCAGMRRTRGCTSAADGQCAPCDFPESHTGLLFLHENCTAACAPGFVWNGRAARCEACAAECPPGSAPPVPRENCTHCAACPAPPPGANFTRGCTWTCGEGGEGGVQNLSGVRRCAPLPSLQQRAPGTPMPTEWRCPPHQRLEASSYTTARCIDCLVVTPGDDQVTWSWTELGAACSWACRPTLYKYFRSGVLNTRGVDAAGHQHVDCVAWEVYQALSRDPSQPITVRETQQYFGGRKVSGARGLEPATSLIGLVSVFVVCML